MIDRFSGQVRRDVAEISGDILARCYPINDRCKNLALRFLSISLPSRERKARLKIVLSLALSAKVYAKVKVTLIVIVFEEYVLTRRSLCRRISERLSFVTYR